MASRMIPAGYLAKRIVARPDWIEAPAVDDILSVSSHVSPDFLDYMCDWRHNGYCIFNSREEIVRLAEEREVDLSGCRLFYYDIFECEFDEATRTWSAFAPDPAFVTSVVRPERARREGFDVVTFSQRNLPECSPLSCNGLASRIAVNRHCLFDGFDDAYGALEAGAFDNSEPGPFRIFAVHSVDVRLSSRPS